MRNHCCAAALDKDGPSRGNGCLRFLPLRQRIPDFVRTIASAGLTGGSSLTDERASRNDERRVGPRGPRCATAPQIARGAARTRAHARPGIATPIDVSPARRAPEIPRPWRARPAVRIRRARQQFVRCFEAHPLPSLFSRYLSFSLRRSELLIS